jgi:prepilin-type N-terminal cleavage/methylation domain-containing protein
MRVARPRSRGFTMLEILVAMAVFTVLGTMVVYFLRQSLAIFYAGERESSRLDRQDTILPQVRSDLANLVLPASFQAPALAPEDPFSTVTPPPPAPPVLVRLRSGYVPLQGAEDEAYKGYPCPWFAFVVCDPGEWSNRLKRRAGEVPVKGHDLKDLTPRSVQEGNEDTRYKPTGGEMEICWIAVPAGAMRSAADRAAGGVDFPAILSLYRGYRAPVGDPDKSLLVPEHLDTAAKIRAACSKVAGGLLHFGATWRRVFATSWETDLGVGQGPTAPYVGPIWDSTCALEKNWPLYRGPQSLGDPSDDVFPAFVRLEVTLAAEGAFGAGKGEFSLIEAITRDQTLLRVDNLDALVQPHLGATRWMKVDHEWVQYDLNGVDYAAGSVRVRRGMRGTRKVPHEAGAWCYVGTPSTLEMGLLFHDRTVLREK